MKLRDSDLSDWQSRRQRNKGSLGFSKKRRKEKEKFK